MDFEEYLGDLHKEPSVDVGKRLREINQQSQQLSRLLYQSPLETQISILAKKQDLILDLLTLIHKQEESS